MLISHAMDLVPLEIAFHIAAKTGFESHLKALAEQSDEPFCRPSDRALFLPSEPRRYS